MSYFFTVFLVANAEFRRMAYSCITQNAHELILDNKNGQAWLVFGWENSEGWERKSNQKEEGGMLFISS